MAHLEVSGNGKRQELRSQAFCFECLDVGTNKKAILVLLRSLCSSETGKPVFPDQPSTEACDYGARQNMENFVAAFHVFSSVVNGVRPAKADSM
jgi:hypothetical protein